jgi:membrane-associated phospholipid phosphatase
MPIDILQKIQAVDNTVKDHFTGKLPTPPTKIDQLLKWVPVASVLLADIKKTEAGTEVAKHLKAIALSETVLNALLFPLKKFASRNRPDSNWKTDSFPSGHTATAFMGAEILNQALKDRAPSLRYSGYAIAAATAAIRVYKKKHWLSDVVAGAALGIVSARIALWVMHKREVQAVAERAH